MPGRRTFCQYDLLVQEAKEVLVPTAAERDVAVIAASPLHGGLLGSKRDHWRQQGRFADLFETQEQVEALLQERDLDPVDAGLRYLLTDPRVSIILSGVDSVGELERSAAVSDGRYLDDELLYLLDNSDAEALVFHTSLGDRVARVMERAPKVKLWIQVDDGGEPTVVDLINAGEIDVVINTPSGSTARADGFEIRTATVAADKPLFTTIAQLAAAVAAFEIKRGDIRVRSLQDYAADRAVREAAR